MLVEIIQKSFAQRVLTEQHQLSCFFPIEILLWRAVGVDVLGERCARIDRAESGDLGAFRNYPTSSTATQTVPQEYHPLVVDTMQRAHELHHDLGILDFLAER